MQHKSFFVADSSLSSLLRIWTAPASWEVGWGLSMLGIAGIVGGMVGAGHLLVADSREWFAYSLLRILVSLRMSFWWLVLMQWVSVFGVHLLFPLALFRKGSLRDWAFRLFGTLFVFRVPILVFFAKFLRRISIYFACIQQWVNLLVRLWWVNSFTKLLCVLKKCSLLNQYGYSHTHHTQSFQSSRLFLCSSHRLNRVLQNILVFRRVSVSLVGGKVLNEGIGIDVRLVEYTRKIT